MVKSLLHLSIETDLLEYAKSLNINISKLLEQVLRQQLDIKVEGKPKDYDLEIGELKSKIAIIESQKEHEKDILEHKEQQESIEKQKQGLFDTLAINIFKAKDSQWQNRITAFQRIFKRKLNIFIEPFIIEKEIQQRLDKHARLSMEDK